MRTCSSFTSIVTESRSMIIRAASFVNAIENAAVTRIIAKARMRGQLLRSITVRAMRSKEPMFREARRKKQAPDNVSGPLSLLS